jgi:hypothetical protein
MDEDPGVVGLVLPLAMPEWKRGFSGGSLEQSGGKIHLKMSANAQAIYSPLALPLKNLNRPTSFTWRQLTIAEDLQIQPREKAEAYRLQINRDQWVFYRSLTPCIRRTVMGLHLNTEFYTGRFCAQDGQFESMVEVNPDEESA